MVISGWCGRRCPSLWLGRAAVNRVPTGWARPCYAVGRGRPRQRIFVVPHARQRVPGVPPALLPAVLRLVGRLGCRRRPRGAHALRAEAARHAADVGGPHRPRGDRARAARASPRPRAVRGLADRGHRAPDAGGVEGLARPRVPREPEAPRALRARVRRDRQGPRVAGAARSRRALPAQLPSPAALRGHQAHATSSSGSSSRTSAPSRGKARASSRRPTSATGTGRTACSSSTGRPAAAARTPRSSSAATRSMPSRSSASTCRGWISSR